MKPMYSIKRIARQDFILAEHITDSREATVAAFEYRCMGYYVRCERVPELQVIYIWVRHGRVNMPGTLPGEDVSRQVTPTHRKRLFSRMLRIS